LIQRILEQLKPSATSMVDATTNPTTTSCTYIPSTTSPSFSNHVLSIAASGNNTDPASAVPPSQSSVSANSSFSDTTSTPTSLFPPSEMTNRNYLSYSLSQSTHRQLLQASPIIPLEVSTFASLVVAKSRFDFTADCDRIRFSIEIGRTQFFFVPGAVVYSQNFYTRTAVTFLESRNLLIRAFLAAQFQSSYYQRCHWTQSWISIAVAYASAFSDWSQLCC